MDDSYPKTLLFFAVFSCLIIICGLIGNTMCFIVWFKEKTTPKFTRGMLQALAVFDNIVLLIVTSQVFSAAVSNDMFIWKDSNWFICRAQAFLGYYTLDVSVYILCALSMERFIAVKWPHKLHIIFTTMAKKVTLLVVFGATMVKPIYATYCSKIQVNFDSDYNETYQYCDFYSDRCASNFAIIDLVTFVVLPTILMLTFNLEILRNLVLRARKSSQLSNTGFDSNGQVKKFSRGTAITKMLLGLALAYVLLTLPLGLFMIAINSDTKLFKNRDELQNIITYGLSLLANTNNATNVFAYYVMYVKFRNTFNALF